MVEHIDEMRRAGIDSFKIEGRAKSHYYTAVVTNAYRGAFDEYLRNPENYKAPEWVLEELSKISHREYSTGFFYGRPENAQTYKSAGYVRDYSVAGVVEGYEDGNVLVRVKNKFSKGQVLDCLEPKTKPFLMAADKIINSKNESVESAPHPMELIKIPYDREIAAGSLLRMKAE
jgi:putative protease